MGVYAFAPRVLEYMAPDEQLDFPDLIRRLIDAGEAVRAYRSDCYWLDIGRHDDYEQALEEFERMRHRLIPEEERSCPARSRGSGRTRPSARSRAGRPARRSRQRPASTAGSSSSTTSRSAAAVARASAPRDSVHA